MGTMLVRQPNGRLALFSTVDDNFYLWNATPQEIVVYEKDRASQDAERQATAWVEGRSPFPIVELEGVLETVRRVHGEEKAEEYREQMTEEVDPADDQDLAGPPLKMERTERGFVIGEFKDRGGLKCSVQKSSTAGEDCIWLGVHEDRLDVCLGNGRGWVQPNLKELVAEKYPGNAGILLNTRMHLSRGQVRQLLPLLRHFVETGDLPEPQDDAPAQEPA
jgi:hypothetical protein